MQAARAHARGGAGDMVRMRGRTGISVLNLQAIPTVHVQDKVCIELEIPLKFPLILDCGSEFKRIRSFSGCVE